MDSTENPESDGEFAFETDHLALRGNKDYSDLLKYIVVLESQRVAALKDIEDLTEARNKALQEPLQFVQQLQAGKVQFPPRHHIREIPQIDWSQYGVDDIPDDEFIRDIKPNTSEAGMKVRGRKFTDSKPETFNQLWSCEEQKRLEELLEIYPEEPIEARRYKKIAKALGTRTPIQVMSRVQKYFAKLAKAGLPIPGRTPKGIGREKCKSILYKKSNFFPQLHVPVKMDDLYDATESPYTSTTATTGMETKVGNKHIVELLRVAKQQRALDETAPVYQNNTTCVGCQAKGFLGARWTDNAGTDYCTDCVVNHLPKEKLTPVRIPLDSASAIQSTSSTPNRTKSHTHSSKRC